MTDQLGTCRRIAHHPVTQSEDNVKQRAALQGFSRALRLTPSYRPSLHWGDVFPGQTGNPDSESLICVNAQEQTVTIWLRDGLPRCRSAVIWSGAGTGGCCGPVRLRPKEPRCGTAFPSVSGKDFRLSVMLVDSHCHLDFPDFASELDAVVERARAVGIDRMVTISTRVKKHAQVLAIAERFPDVFCSVGTHPNHAHEEMDVGVDTLVALTQHPKVVALGEAGLDYYRNTSPRDVQIASFREHIAAARQTRLPLVIHSRECDQDMMRILTEENGKGAFPAILHCFTGSRELAFVAIELGLHVSFTGILTFKRSDELREIARLLPADRIMLETDAPYLAPLPFRGERNEPAYVVETAKVLAQTLGVSTDEIARRTTENFFTLFWKVPRKLADAA